MVGDTIGFASTEMAFVAVEVDEITSEDSAW